MNDDVELAEPYPLGQQPIAVDSQWFHERRARREHILVESTIARNQLAAARRAWLKVATRMVPSTTDDPTVTAPIACRSATEFGTERAQVEVTPFPVQGTHGARNGRRHLPMAPAADSHQATPRWSGPSADHSGEQSKRSSSGNCGGSLYMQ
jgi:hypothetical protein